MARVHDDHELFLNSRLITHRQNTPTPRAIHASGHAICHQGHNTHRESPYHQTLQQRGTEE